MIFGNVGSWLLTMFSVSAMVGVIEIFSPDGKIKKYILYTVSIVIMVVLISPLAGILQGLPDFINTISLISDEGMSGENPTKDNSDFEEESTLSDAEMRLIKSGKHAIEKHAQTLISTKFHISESSVFVVAELEIGDVRNIILLNLHINIDASDVYVKGEKKTLFDAEDAIQKYVSDYYGCPVTVETDL